MLHMVKGKGVSVDNLACAACSIGGIHFGNRLI